MANRVSWKSPQGHRMFGKFIQWSNDYALVRQGVKIVRVHKRDLTFERP